MPAFIAPPARIPLFLRAGIWIAEKITGKPMLPARLLAWYPKAAFGSAALEGLVAHHDGKIDKRMLKIVRLTASFAAACPFCIDMNSDLYKEAGIADAEFLALQSQADPDNVPSFSIREKLAVRYARLISSTPLRFPSDFIDGIKAHFSEREMVVLASTAAQVNYWARLIQALGIPPAGFSEGCSVPSPAWRRVQTSPERFRQTSGGQMKTRSDSKWRNRTSAAFAIFLLLFLAAMPVKAGNAAGERLTLEDAVRMALKNNHELQAQRNAHAAKGAEVGVARSSLLPKITLEERYLRTASPAYAFMTKLSQQRIEMADFAPESLNHPSAVDDFQTAVMLEQPLFVQKARVGLEMSRTEAAASEEALHRKKEEVAFKVIQYYLMAGTAGGYVAVAQKALEDAQEHQRLAEVRYAAGLGLYSDTLRAATAVAEARQRLVSAEKNLSVAKRALGLMIGSEDAVEVAAEIPAVPVREIESLRTQSLGRRDVKSLELRTENARNQIKLAEAGYYPMVGVGGTYQWNDHNHPLGGEGDGWQLMAFLRWELFDGAKTKHEKIKAGYQASEAEEVLKGMKKMVSFQVDEAWLTLEEAKKNQELAQEELKTAEEGRRLVKVRYEGALSPMVDLLDAQVSFDRARANRVAKENEYKLAIFNLGYASGTILQELQIEEQNGRTK